MPEICEVIITTHFIKSKLKNKLITRIKVLSGRYLKNKLDVDLINKNQPFKLSNIDSKGKFIWFELKKVGNDDQVYILNTLGLTGTWSLVKNSFSRIKINYVNANNEKFKLYYNDQLNFGTLKITDNYDEIQKKLNKLGPDLIKDDFDYVYFKEKINKLKKKKAPIIKILMTQEDKNGVGSGIGNYLSVEILYNAKISPFRKINSLSEAEIKKLFHSIKFTLRLCYYNNSIGYMEEFADFIEKHKRGIQSGKYPNYLENVNIGNAEFKFNVYRKKEDPDGNPVKVDKIINNRSTYWVPAVQK